MFIYTEESATPRLTPWGLEVRRRLLERNNMKQMDLIRELEKKNGITIVRSTLTMLLQGRGTSNHRDTIHAINEILGIPEAV